MLIYRRLRVKIVRPKVLATIIATAAVAAALLAYGRPQGIYLHSVALEVGGDLVGAQTSTPGKVCVDGIADVAGQKVFVLRMLQARDPGLVGQPFFAQYDTDVTWLTDLKPALGNRALLPGLDT